MIRHLARLERLRQARMIEGGEEHVTLHVRRVSHASARLTEMRMMMVVMMVMMVMMGGVVIVT